MTKDELNAALAHRLAPLVGEAAVHDPAPECPNGHSLASYQPLFDREIGAVCQECAIIHAQATGISNYFQALEWARAHPERMEWEIGQTPKDFTNPSVLLAIMKALGKDHPFGMQISRLTRMAPDDATLYWCVRVRWQFNEYTADGEDLGTVMADAWYEALGGDPDAN
jgi:hypothetical protein